MRRHIQIEFLIASIVLEITGLIVLIVGMLSDPSVVAQYRGVSYTLPVWAAHLMFISTFCLWSLLMMALAIGCRSIAYAVSFALAAYLACVVRGSFLTGQIPALANFAVALSCLVLLIIGLRATRELFGRGQVEVCDADQEGRGRQAGRP